jgi:hypothetical protein
VMETQKVRWRSIGIPERLFNSVKELIVHTGNVSVAEREVLTELVCEKVTGMTSLSPAIR